MINIIEAKIKYNTIYTCSKCGKQQVGDTVYEEYKIQSTLELKVLIDNEPQHSQHMPEGWSYNGEFNCGCRKE